MSDNAFRVAIERLRCFEPHNMGWGSCQCHDNDLVDEAIAAHNAEVDDLQQKETALRVTIRELQGIIASLESTAAWSRETTR